MEHIERIIRQQRRRMISRRWLNGLLLVTVHKELEADRGLPELIGINKRTLIEGEGGWRTAVLTAAARQEGALV